MFDWSCTNVDNVITIMKNYSIKNYQKLINNPMENEGDTSYGLLTFVHHNDISYRERTIKRFLMFWILMIIKYLLLQCNKVLWEKAINMIWKKLKKFITY